MTPYEIGILMHYHTSTVDYPGTEPIAHETLSNFVRIDLLIDRGVFGSGGGGDRRLDVMTRYKATERLHAYCDALCSVPLPVIKWVIPES